jgi:leukotriene-A4 hydrolase
MENPVTTYVTPTLLAGDRSLDRVICHEIAHSWTGNLVSCASWEHFWLNEGWTMFLERKTIGRLEGKQAFYFGASQGATALADAVKTIGADHPFTRLVPDLSNGGDPDDAFSRIPYEKGFYFLYYLQTVAGGDEPFEAFMRDYLKTFAHGNVDSETFKQYYLDYFKDVPGTRDIDWDTWFYKPGMPPVKNEYDSSLGKAAEDLARRWHTSDVMGIGSNGPSGASAADTEGWGAEQVCFFLDKLLEFRAMQPMHPKTTRAMAAAYGFDASKNAEIRGSWYRLCLQAGDTAVHEQTVAFLREQGRMKYLRPLYKALAASGAQGATLAQDTFKATRNNLHPIAAKMVAVDLGV